MFVAGIFNFYYNFQFKLVNCENYLSDTYNLLERPTTHKLFLL